MKFLDVMLIILGLIGVSIILLSVWIAISIRFEAKEEVLFKFNLLTFFVGLSYLVFVLIIFKLVKKRWKECLDPNFLRSLNWSKGTCTLIYRNSKLLIKKFWLKKIVFQIDNSENWVSCKENFLNYFIHAHFWFAHVHT